MINTLMLKTLSTDAEKKQAYWFVMRVYKNEKTAEERLSGEGGLEFFIPKHAVRRVYHGVESKRLVPFIPSLVFVHASQSEIIAFKRDSFNMLQFSTWEIDGERKYMIVPDKEMSDFIQTCTQNELETTFFNMDELGKIDLKRGSRVRIHGGSLDGVEGFFTRIKGKRNRRLVVMVEDLIAATVTVTPDQIELLPQK